MKTSTTLFLLAACIALVAVPASAYPFFIPPHLPIFPPHPFLPYPPGAHFPSLPSPSAPGPSSGGPPQEGYPIYPSFPPPHVDMSQCARALHDVSASLACSPLSYNVRGCCIYLHGLGEACSPIIPYYQSPAFQASVSRVCDTDSSSPPTPPSA